MSETNLRLFDDEHEVLGLQLDQIDTIPDAEIKNRWPSLLAELIDLFHLELVRQGQDEVKARKTASKLVAALAHYYGGRAVYLPTGDSLKSALRDNQLYLDWSKSNGNIDKLAKKYGLTNSTVYAILRAQSALHRHRYQLSLAL